MREETTRQLNRAVVDDWNYQTSFKQKRQEEEKLAEMAAAYHEKQVKMGWRVLTLRLLFERRLFDDISRNCHFPTFVRMLFGTDICAMCPGQNKT